MNWFEPTFADLQAHAGLLAEAWRLMAIVLLGVATGSVLAGLRQARHRALFALIFFILWEAFLPKAPLGFLDGRVAGLQDEVLVALLLITVGLFGVMRSLRHARIVILPIAIAALMAGGLGYAYHLILINGMDAAQRRSESVHLSHHLDLDPEAWNQVCGIPELTCGSGLPQTGSPVFDRDVADWMTHALPGGKDGRVASSDGTLASRPPHAWAAERVGGKIRWIRSDRSEATAALKLAFFLFANAALLFWFGGALIVEALHVRAFRRRGRDSPKAAISS